ncbi:hypothetical protein E3Q19_00217 [Wallemia mellicola]|uniref:Uncharacterized protein n=1 Tax=Wallemia mellicola TaxID=1708541 RepID=A0A4T0TJ48_9BASI|nr:hypothetical protein E3Q19_00217 [Wallemia mellicola]TIC11023.1 hypothetical protein E3Q14_02502 [Wallemia mellicola]TIC12289.1 hypothetical protein E3Q15_02385 [Wallemia mellicola]TIC20598.1 hypothetical protein E3Q13_00509 [Wallemia mellicola]TIC56294.1 hypothetical protein E3Q05_01782 [Wallemia mellicola]
MKLQQRMSVKTETGNLFGDADPFAKASLTRSSSTASSISQTNSFEYDHHLETPSSACSEESFCLPLNDNIPKRTCPAKTLSRPPSLLFHLPRRS